MNVKRFIFKIVAILTYIVKLMLILLPVTYVGVTAKEGAWRYGFTFIQNNFEVALFLAFAIAFMVSLYHALSFDVIEGAPAENYLKTNQKVFVRGNLSLDELFAKMQENTKRFKNVTLSDQIIQAERKVIALLPDQITITKKDDLFTLHSQPFSTLWFIDFGRNYKNVKELAKVIKNRK